MQNFKEHYYSDFGFVLLQTELKDIYDCESFKNKNLIDILNLMITKNVGAGLPQSIKLLKLI